MKDYSNLPIGIFDSGVGGLTVVRQIHKLMPQEDLVYLGDTARVPYGTKSPGTVIRFAREDMRFLERKKVKAVVVACNTVSAWALPTLRAEFDLPIWGVIHPGAEAALQKTKRFRIGVMATAATIQSNAYAQWIQEHHRGAHVFGEACPLLVPLVEEGWISRQVTLDVLKIYLAPLLRHKVDTVVLGCTHYPLLANAIRKVTQNKIALVDSAESCARYVQKEMQLMKLSKSDSHQDGFIQPYVTDETDRFDRLAERFLGKAPLPAIKVELD